MKSYHVGLKMDEQRSATPVGAWNVPAKPLGALPEHPTNPAAGVTLHVETRRWDPKTNDYFPQRGQIVRLTDEQHAGLVAALQVESGPLAIVTRESTGHDGKPVRETRIAPHGRGLVVQWHKSKDGWRAALVNKAAADYEPPIDPANEVPLHRYVYADVVSDAGWNPPSIDMTRAEARQPERDAAKVEAEEQKRDPSGFEQQKRTAEQAKRAGVPLAKA